MAERAPRHVPSGNLSGFLLGLGSSVTSAGIYVHVPYCASRCTYCDFYSIGTGGELMTGTGNAFIDAVRQQVRSVRADLPITAESLYVGGGTPSLLGARVGDLVGVIDGAFGLRPGAEVTVEANPDDLSPPLLASWRQAGVTRVSLGVQALNNDVLSSFGRRHTAEQAARAVGMLRGSGLRWSVDLMAGVPGVADSEWADWLARVVDWGATHVSVYPLTIEEGTVLASRVECGSYPEPDSDAAAGQMVVAARELARLGIERYEVANFAVPGEESHHNFSYWTGVPYLGFGPSAASMLPTGDGGRARFTLHATREEHLSNPERGTSSSPGSTPSELEILTPDETLREDVMLGLRTKRGVSAELAARAGLGEVMARLVRGGLVESLRGDGAPGWALTERGWLLGNEVFSSVLFDS